METASTEARPLWKTAVYVLSILAGLFVALLALGVGVSGQDGVRIGALVVFAAMLLFGGGLVIWGVSRLRS